jgi:anti-sigma factor RsiW
MDPADLLDYALGRLEGPRRERLERRMAGDPALAGQMARLIRNLHHLLDDGQADYPPGGLPTAPSLHAPRGVQGSAWPDRPDEEGDRSTSGAR